MNTPIINDFISDEPKIFSVSEINRLVKKVLTDSFDSVWIKGEISNFTKASSGHGTSQSRTIPPKSGVLCLEVKIILLIGM